MLPLLVMLSGTAAHALAVWVGGPAPAPAAGNYEMHNVNRTFAPPAIIVPVGSQVRFPNDDPFYHSIYSADKVDGFDIGYYFTGPGKYVTFSQPSVVHVRCHIHAYMHGMIIVAGGPYSAVDASGKYSIVNLPAGKYTLHEIMPDGTDKTSSVTLNADTTLNI
jgi:plastocyanin